jgi:hypothetical protein
MARCVLQVNTSKSVDMIRGYSMHRLTHLEKYRAREAAYSAAHRDEIRLRNAAYRAANRESLRVKKAAYAKATYLFAARTN